MTAEPAAALVAAPGARLRRARAWGVHLFTASGIAFDFLALAEMLRPEPDPRRVLAWLMVPVVIDALDGPLARRWEVKRWAGAVDGRTLDDIVDYVTFTLAPLLLVARMGWLPEPAALFVVPALVASLLGFGNVEAKQEADGFFRGFPSYWNVYAFYAGIWHAHQGPWGPALLLVLLTVLTVAPVRFLYPNLAPVPWRRPLLAGAAVWTALLLALLPSFPNVSVPLALLSLSYPAFYVGLSLVLDRKSRARVGPSSG